MNKSVGWPWILAAMLMCFAAGIDAVRADSSQTSSPQTSSWPSRLIKATIPFGAGSATDVVPRLVFDRLAVELGQPIVVENRVGGGGTLGTIPMDTAFSRIHPP
jgi:tripartite-type tricarboxylate transporter receptor subunit TctC